MQLSDILSKPVISLYDGTNEGFIINACFNKNLQKLKYLIVAGQEKTDEEEIYVLDLNNVYEIGKDAIVIKNNSSLELLSNLDGNFCINNPINSTAYTTDGADLGHVKDVTLDNDLNITQFTLSSTTLSNDKLASFSNGTIIFQSNDKTINVKKFRPGYKKPTNDLNQPVKILSLPKLEDNKKYKLQEATIQRLTANTSLLLGRKLTKQIQTQNGELIARKDSRITPKIITTATNHQKLRELALYSE